MLDVVSKVDQHKEFALHVEEIEAIDTKGGEIMRDTTRKQALKRKLLQYYDKHQKLELVLATQEFLEFYEHDLVHIDSNEEEKCWTNTRDNDI
jgi:hypothetical protein